MDICNVIVTGKSGAGKQPRIDVLKELFNLKQLSTGDLFRSCIKAFNELGIKEDITEYAERDILDNDEAMKILSRAEFKEDKREELLLGMRSKWYSYQGLFVPDDITNSVFKHYFLQGNACMFVLDGYPRTKSQCKFLLDLCSKMKTNISFLLLVENDDERIISRTIGRRICPVCKTVYHIDYKPPLDGKFCYNDGAEVILRADDMEEKIRRRLNEYYEKTIEALEFLMENNIPIAKVTGHLEDFSVENVKKTVLDSLKGIGLTA